MAEDEHPSAFEDQILDETDANITGEELPVKQYFYLYNLYQHKNTAVNKCHLQFDNEEKVMMSCERVGKGLHDHQKLWKLKVTIIATPRA